MPYISQFAHDLIETSPSSSALMIQIGCIQTTKLGKAGPLVRKKVVSAVSEEVFLLYQNQEFKFAGKHC